MKKGYLQKFENVPEHVLVSDYRNSPVDSDQRNDIAGFFYGKYSPTIKNSLCRQFSDKHLIEDLLQETFSGFFKMIGEKEFDENFTSIKLLMQIAKRRGVDHIRKIRGTAHSDNKRPFELGETESERDFQTIIGNEPISRARIDGGPGEENPDILERLRKKIRQLPTRQRQVIDLYYSGELKYDEIAEELKISPNTVDNNIKKARKNLKRNL